MCESSFAAARVFFVLFSSPCSSKQWSVAGLSVSDHFFKPFFEGSRVKVNGSEGKIKPGGAAGGFSSLLKTAEDTGNMRKD